MYLKRLELKGFKSFANKTIINLEPGISAIVGPNGSGKSNICDAILWVLGENHVKNLRGSIMEDVIFAGSSEKSAVSLAEVCLVLDNSSNTLPLDYSEVSITRRLYRSGENTYLINDCPVRRLDVTDILHDSGIGSDTNSIISQGNLDSILQSHPSDRKAFIEEAAGVLKHKQRKLKSKNKLQKIDQNMIRINDVIFEIERQLKPLRIQAKRAKVYDSLCQELSDLTLKIAVDDLKIIKKKWDETQNIKNKTEDDLNKKKQIYTDSKNQLDQLNNKNLNLNNDILNFGNKQRRLNSVVDNLNSFILILKEKLNNAKNIINNQQLNVYSPESSSIKDDLKKEIIDIEDKINKNKKDIGIKSDQLNELNKLHISSKNNYKKTQDEYEQLSNKITNNQKKLENIENKINLFKNSKEETKTKIDVSNAKLEMINSKLVDLQTDSKKQDNIVLDKEKSLDNINLEIEKINAEIEKINNNIENFNSEKNSLNDVLIHVNSEVSTINKLIENEQNNYNSITKWFNKQKGEFKSGVLADVVEIDSKYLKVVQNLLNDNFNIFVTNNDINDIQREIYNLNSVNGTLDLLTANEKFISKNYKDASLCAKEFDGILLADKITYVIEDFSLSKLFCNVVIVDDFKTCCRASKKYTNLICVSMDGCYIYPNGNVRFVKDSNLGDSHDNKINILQLKQEIKALKKKSKNLKNKIQTIENKFNDEQLKLERSQKSLLAKQTIRAEIEGQLENLNSNKQSINNDISQLNIKIKEEKELIDTLKKTFKSNDYDLETLQNEKDSINKQIDKDKNLINSINKEIKNLEQIYYQNKDNLSQTNSSIESLKSSLDSLNLLYTNAKKRLVEVENNESIAKEEINKHKVICSRCSSTISVLENLKNQASDKLSSLNKTTEDISNSYKRIEEKISSLKDECNKNQKIYENAQTQLQEINIELGKLEVKVQNAVDVIDKQNLLSVDEALKLPDLKNRKEAEDRAFKLNRRITNIGSVNKDAIEDYENLKDRFDFLNEQLTDLKNARISLKKITQIIDSRIKQDFINTFNVVNKNFKEIFEILFPGGQASLELDSPDDIENTGIEVKAQPRGKRISRMSLMSGGEKSLVALCLLFAVYKTRTTPFYILDEVEAALDDTNLTRLLQYFDNLAKTTQLILITHQRRTMEMSDVLYGVSMNSNGITKVVSQKLDRTNK